MESQSMMRYAQFKDDLIEHIYVGKLLDAYIASYMEVEGKSPSKIIMHPLVWDKLFNDRTPGIERDLVRWYYKNIPVELTIGQYKIGLE